MNSSSPSLPHLIGRQSQDITDCVIRYYAIARDRPQHLLCHRLTSSMACNWNSVFLTTKILAFEERPWNGIFGFGLARNGTRALSLAPFFARSWLEFLVLSSPKSHGNACYVEYKDLHYSYFVNTVRNYSLEDHSATECWSCLSVGLGEGYSYI